MEDDKKFGNTQNEDGQESAPKMFTQEEVDEIIRKRLARERKKGDSEQETDTGRESDLEARELKLMAKEKLMEAGMPLNLAEVLNYSDEDSLDEAIETIRNLNKEAPKSWGQRQSQNRAPNADPYRKAMGLDRK